MESGASVSSKTIDEANEMKREASRLEDSQDRRIFTIVSVKIKSVVQDYTKTHSR